MNLYSRFSIEWFPWPDRPNLVSSGFHQLPWQAQLFKYLASKSLNSVSACTYDLCRVKLRPKNAVRSSNQASRLFFKHSTCRLGLRGHRQRNFEGVTRRNHLSHDAWLKGSRAKHGSTHGRWKKNCSRPWMAFHAVLCL